MVPGSATSPGRPRDEQPVQVDEERVFVVALEFEPVAFLIGHDLVVERQRKVTGCRSAEPISCAIELVSAP